MQLTTTRLKDISKIVLGANIGFLPSLMFYMVVIGKWDIVTSIILWGLTTGVIISEWWSLDETLEKYPLDSTPILVLILIYLCALIFLPVSLLIENAQTINLFPYVVVFLLLSILDIPISLFYCKIVLMDKDKKEFSVRFVFDLVFIGYYILFIYAVLPTDLTLALKTLILAGFYLGEVFVDYFITPHFVK